MLPHWKLPALDLCLGTEQPSAIKAHANLQRIRATAMPPTMLDKRTDAAGFRRIIVSTNDVHCDRTDVAAGYSPRDKFAAEIEETPSGDCRPQAPQRSANREALHFTRSQTKLMTSIRPPWKTEC